MTGLTGDKTCHERGYSSRAQRVFVHRTIPVILEIVLEYWWFWEW